METIVIRDEVLILTALLYFKEALQKQQFEQCAELTASAREAGAEQGEISAVIAEYLRGDKVKANKKRLRITTEE